MLKFLLGLILGTLIGSTCSADPRIADIVIRPMKPAIVHIPESKTCSVKPLTTLVLDVLAESRRLTVETEWEYGGVIFKDERGMLCVSKPATSKHPRFLWKFYNTPDGWSVAAFYHTHPGTDEYAHLFSGVDARSACRIGAPSFIVTDDRFVYRLDPHPVICNLPETPDIVIGRLIGLVQP